MFHRGHQGHAAFRRPPGQGMKRRSWCSLAVHRLLGRAAPDRHDSRMLSDALLVVLEDKPAHVQPLIGGRQRGGACSPGAPGGLSPSRWSTPHHLAGRTERSGRRLPQFTSATDRSGWTGVTPSTCASSKCSRGPPGRRRPAARRGPVSNPCCCFSCRCSSPPHP
jgi:hypothetical protein